MDVKETPVNKNDIAGTEMLPEAPTIESQPLRSSSVDSVLAQVLLAEEPIVASVEDHFTLPVASNLIRFRSRKNAARVYESKGVQMVLEESYDHVTEDRKITVRRMTDETFGAQFLRFLYTIVCSLFTGFFFVFCLQVLLFLVLDLAVQSGATQINAQIHVGGAVGVILAIIVFVHAFSEAMVICGHYISDMWTGHFLAKQVIFKTVSHVAIEWIFFVAFLFVPLLVMCITLLLGRADWWTITALTWFTCVMIFFALFCYGVVYYEVQAAYHFAENSLQQQREKYRNDMNESERSTSTVPNNTHGYRHVVQVLMHCVLLRQRHFYSGSEQRDFLARSFFNDLGATNDISQANIHQDTKTTTLSWWAKITTWLPDSVFRQLQEPYRLYTLDDVRDYRPFLTESTWSLEKIFCRPRQSRYIAIVKGPGALSKSQIHSSLFCSMIGTCIILVVVVSLLVWCNTPGLFILLVIVIAIIAARNVLFNMRNLLRVGNDLIDSMGMELGTTSFTRNRHRKEMLPSMDIIPDDSLGQKDEELNDKRRARGNTFGESKQCWDRIGAEPSEAVFLVTEYKRVNEVSQTFSWVMFYLELAVFIIFPAGCLLVININMAILFGICAAISAIRHYINAAIVIEESGNIDLVGGDTKEELWENKSRLVEIVDAVTVGKSRKVWVAVLGTMGFGVMAIFSAAVGMSTENTENRSFDYLPNFYYQRLEDDMRYPTCTLSNMHGGFGENSTMADFAFLSSIAYGRTVEGTNNELKRWFGHDGTEAVDFQEYVDDFRATDDPDNVAVYFKLIKFPQQNLGMIVVRGTSNYWDMLADSQLWSAAALMQLLRAALPAGGIWTPILDQLVNWINTLEGASLEKVSFYRLTTKFAEKLKADSQFKWVQITGHSLGGGLSMITGAQAHIPAIGLSGPNALISGRSFNPIVTAEEMNKYTFNIVPERDIVPRLDDLADQNQHIRCSAEANDFVGCHTAKRSLCEILYTCGTGNRPALCHCVTEFGYPKPITDGDEDFDELCGISKE